VSNVFEVRIIVDHPRFQLDARVGFGSDELLRTGGMAAVEDELKSVEGRL